MKTAAFHTLGCKVNQYDTQAMLEKFRAAGYEIVPFDADADVYVINTCTVTGTGDKKSLQLARRLRREHPDSALILAGCLAQRKPEDLLETGARLVIGTQHRGEVVELLEKALRENTSINAVNELNATTPFEPLTITSQEEHTRATLKIQEGCNNHCTYCIIPSVRGPIRSRPGGWNPCRSRTSGASWIHRAGADRHPSYQLRAGLHTPPDAAGRDSRRAGRAGRAPHPPRQP